MRNGMKKMKLNLVLGAALLVGTTAVVAAPSSNVAFTPETINTVKNADAEAGKTKAASCAGCHGPEGVSMNPAWPSLAGQNANFTYKQLKDYKDRTRTDVMMMGMVMPLSDQDMADIAAYYGTLPGPAAKDGGADLPLAEAMHNGGAADRELPVPACKACHGSTGGGQIVAVPALAGQNAGYIKATMQKYKNGTRANDVYSVMRNIAKSLSDDEIAQLADFYASMGN